MRANAWRHRQWRGHSAKPVRAHLGPGQKKYLPGWVNVDANLVSSKPDVWADLRYALPFPDRSVDCIYSHHVVEHLPDLRFHFAELFRCLKPGGAIRVAGPHGDNAMKAFETGLSQWFDNWPDNRRSLGGRFENFIFCRGEHLTILTGSFLAELAEDAGFVDIRAAGVGETAHPELFSRDALDTEPNDFPSLPRTIVLEAIKPRDPGGA
jgi:SAM-dependent methyltransferase